MKEKLFNEFNSVPSKQWKQQIQYELKGADYNETLVWESPEGIKVKPFYHIDESYNPLEVNSIKNTFKIVQNIFVHDLEKSINRTYETLSRGAESIRFTLENESLELEKLLNTIPQEIQVYIKPLFLSSDFITKIHALRPTIILEIDPIGQLAKEGNWFTNLENDFLILNQSKTSLNINAETYQNAGANIVQQLAYTLAHCNEYFNRIKNLTSTIIINVAVGSNYFFEIAKLRALRLLFNTLAKEYNYNSDCHIIATPTKRNKTLYDYNVNMLRTTTECMSAILGGANAVANLAYDAIYHKDNEFGDRISRNQLLVLKHESYFDKVNNPADGSYYIEELTQQLAEKALILFKDIEKGGGFITQLIEGTIQRKIKESADKEQELFNNGKEILLGTNKYPNKNDYMKNDLELYPFVKQNPRKTLISPIIERRLAEKLEQERLQAEA
ncbi:MULTISPECIES: methylmalonyl-CoA mutase subunit beta [Flavobacterium]|uniref:Methylmalonyl-CoA mutase n=2 Tax=Flavobacterium TaxID=237 RepID=A0A2N9PBQ5_9FLAO|nr:MULTISPECIES: methylmalonyl-CoA mutase subunit beta [Flavobacterium]QYS89351.1 methylmalonyl-CoA mutase subunit beta [Flavobacterium davisii]RVU90565.1 methylmalonyl-CoA mutase [Flavobacterium columnare]SPE77790.1 Methylmalonyl-CoA mutase [Flavobacterium columnare]